MGGFYSKSSKEKEKDGKLRGNAPLALPFRPYFRQHSADESNYVVGLNDVCVKRKVQCPVHNEPIISIETVLHDDWWKDDTIDKDPDMGNFTQSPANVRRFLPPLPSIPVSNAVNVSDDDTYTTIGEAEGDGIEVADIAHEPPLSRFEGITPPLPVEEEEPYHEDYGPPPVPPRPVLRGNPRSLPEDEKQATASLPKRLVDKPTQQSNMSTNDQSDGEPGYIQYGEVTEEQTKCFEYSEMVKIFKPLIIQNVRIHDILPHLSFLDNHKDIYELKKHHSEKEAVLTMLEQLDKCNTLGKWHKFIDVLSTCGYTYIVDNIRGYKFITHHYQADYLKILTPKIKNMIIPTELIPYLVAKSVISDTDRENILSDCNNFGNIHGAITLLDRVTRKHRNWFMLFIEALEEARFEEVATSLRIERLMGNGRVKDTDRVHLADSDDVPPPIPPRIPIDLKHHNYDYALCECIDCIKESNDTPKSRVADDDIESNGTVANDMNDETDEPINEAAQFSYLEDEISKLKHEEQNLENENSLLEKKSYHCEKVVDHLKKKNQLKYSIVLMEKEREALRNAPITIEENHADQLAVDMYYPDRNRSHGVCMNRVGVLDLLNDLSVDAQALALDTPSPVPVYCPTFNKTKIRLLPSDSGMGTSDVDYEEMGDVVN